MTSDYPTYTAYTGEEWTIRPAFTHEGVQVERLSRVRPGAKDEYRFTLPNNSRFTVMTQRQARKEIDLYTTQTATR
jgi:hypothetical protein